MLSNEDKALPTGPAAPEKTTAVWLGTMGVLTLVAIGAGGLSGSLVIRAVKDELRNKGSIESPETGTRYAGSMRLRDLPPIITNLAEPNDAWIRLQAAMIFDVKAMPAPESDAARIAEDILAFLRTLSIGQISGASALQHLHEDLNERAAIRSEGRVRELVIQTLVVQ